MAPSGDKVRKRGGEYETENFSRSHIKAMPVIGPAVKLANGFSRLVCSRSGMLSYP